MVGSGESLRKDSMVCERICHRVSEGHLHVGIVEGDPRAEDLMAEPVAKDELVVIVPIHHRFAAQTEVGLEELARESWILRECGSAARQIVDRVSLDREMKPNLFMEFDSSQITKESVVEGLGVSLVSIWAIQRKVEQGLLSTLRIKDYPVMSDFLCVVRESRFQRHVVRGFREFVLE